MSEPGDSPSPAIKPVSHSSAASAARLHSGGLMLAVAAAIAVLTTLLAFLLPAPSPGAVLAERAAVIVRSAGLLHLIGGLGVASAMALALAGSLLVSRPTGTLGAWGRLGWRLMIVTAVLFVGVDLFNLFALVPLARDVSAGGGLYAFFEGQEIHAIGVATLVFSCAALLVFVAETSARHRAIGAGWIAFGLVSAASGIAGGIGMLLNLQRLALLFIVSQLCFIPLLRLGIRIAASGPKASRDSADS